MPLILAFLFMGLLSSFLVNTAGLVTILVLILVSPFAWAFFDARRSKGEYDTFPVYYLAWIRLKNGNLWAGVTLAIIFAYIGHIVEID